MGGSTGTGAGQEHLKTYRITRKQLVFRIAGRGYIGDIKVNIPEYPEPLYLEGRWRELYRFQIGDLDEDSSVVFLITGGVGKGSLGPCLVVKDLEVIR